MFVLHLVYVFSTLYKHSLVPDAFGKGIIIPLLKNSDGNRLTSDNYRGITLSPVMSKLFEMVLLLQFKDQLSSDPLQFGFKSKSSCSHAIFAFKTTVDHYIKNGSTVSVCALDISKAFDHVDDYKLFNVLMIDHCLKNLLVYYMIGSGNVLYVCVGVRHILVGFKYWLGLDKVEFYLLCCLLFIWIL